MKIKEFGFFNGAVGRKERGTINADINMIRALAVVLSIKPKEF